MDSLGRRVYGVDERTYERELKTYFDRNFEDRVSERLSPRANGRNTEQVPSGGGGMNILAQLTAVFRFLILVFSFYLLYITGKKFMEEMNQMNREDDQGEQEGDVFDKMFGSEFKGKFKNARQNRGVYQKRQEEMRLRNLKDEGNTTSPEEIRKLIIDKSSIGGLVAYLERIADCTQEQYLQGVFIRDLTQLQFILRIIYQGYTYRELLSPKTKKYETLKEASSYIVHCLMA